MQPWSQLTPLLVWGSYIWIIPAVFTPSIQILIVSGFMSKLWTITAGILLCIIWNKAKYYARLWRLCWWPVARPGDLVLSWAALEADTGLYWATVEPDQPPHLEARWAQLDWGMETALYSAANLITRPHSDSIQPQSTLSIIVFQQNFWRYNHSNHWNLFHLSTIIKCIYLVC